MSKQQGSSLLEAIIAIAVLGIVVGAASTYFAQSSTALRVENAKQMQTTVVERIQQALANPEAISRTMDHSSLSPNFLLMKNCIEGAGCNAVATNPANNLKLDIYDAYLAPGATTPQRLAGPGVGWDQDGNWCSPGDVVNYPGCVFNSEVKFWATCPLDAASKPLPTCAQASFINFKFQVRPNTSHIFNQKVVDKANDKTLNSFPKDSDYNSSEPMGAVRVRVADIMARRGGTCGVPTDNKKMVGVDENGKPICRCIDGSNVTPCKAQVCAKKNQIMVGFKQSGAVLVPDCIDQASCTNDTTGKCPCMSVDLATNGDCGPGFWMVSIDYGTCTATTEKDKGGPETIKCSNKRGRCCKLDVQ